MPPETKKPAAIAEPADHGEGMPIRFGTLKGKIWIADNFDDPLPDDILDAFENGPLFPAPEE
jgi:hypothetical protein